MKGWGRGIPLHALLPHTSPRLTLPHFISPGAPHSDTAQCRSHAASTNTHTEPPSREGTVSLKEPLASARSAAGPAPDRPLSQKPTLSRTLVPQDSDGRVGAEGWMMSLYQTHWSCGMCLTSSTHTLAYKLARVHPRSTVLKDYLKSHNSLTIN